MPAVPKPVYTGKVDTSDLPFGVKPREQKKPSGLKSKTTLRESTRKKAAKRSGKIDTSSLAFPIQPRIEDPEIVKACRKPNCERCGKKTGNYDPHHIIGGPGRPDHPWNLIMLDGQRAIDGCHKAAQIHEIPDSELWELQSRKFGVPAEVIRWAMESIEGGPHEKSIEHDALVELAGIAANDPTLKGNEKGRALVKALALHVSG